MSLIILLKRIYFKFLPQVAKDILPLFRSWYEEAKRFPIWRKLRMIVVHSTEIYVPLQLKQSPFNVGLPIQLGNFSFDEVKKLANCYGINCQEAKISQLFELVGGHPALVSIAFYCLFRGEIILDQLLESASNTTGIYNYHLQRHWVNLDENPDLLEAFNCVIKSDDPVSLEPIFTYRLSSMGLIKQVGNKVVTTCDLYRQSFFKE